MALHYGVYIDAAEMSACFGFRDERRQNCLFCIGEIRNVGLVRNRVSSVQDLRFKTIWETRAYFRITLYNDLWRVNSNIDDPYNHC